MRWLVFLWLGFVTALSLAPLSVKSMLGAKGHFHEAGHLIIFLITAVLLCWTAVTVRARLLRYLAVCCFGVAMETLEAIVYGNRFEWEDVLFDFAGAFIGVIVMSLVSSSFERAEISTDR